MQATLSSFHFHCFTRPNPLATGASIESSHSLENLGRWVCRSRHRPCWHWLRYTRDTSGRLQRPTAAASNCSARRGKLTAIALFRTLLKPQRAGGMTITPRQQIIVDLKVTLSVTNGRACSWPREQQPPLPISNDLVHPRAGLSSIACPEASPECVSLRLSWDCGSVVAGLWARRSGGGIRTSRGANRRQWEGLPSQSSPHSCTAGSTHQIDTPGKRKGLESYAR